MKTLLSLLAAVALVVPTQGEILEQVLVKVNGDIITKTELENRQIDALRQRLGQQIDPATLQNDAELKKVLLEITPGLLVNAIDELIVVQLGRDKGYRLQDEQFQGWLKDMRKQNNLEDDERFRAALQSEGMTIDDLRRQVERNFLLSRVQQDEVGSKLTITEEEARQYYLAHKGEFVDPASVTLREIMIEVPTATQAGEAGVNVAAMDEAEKEAKAVRARILGGEDFGKVAAEVSDAPSKANGGLIGPFNMNDVSDSLKALLAKMKPGDVTEPLRAAKGFQILKLETLKESSVQSFDSVRDLVADRVYEARQQSEMRKFLARIRSQALIEWKNQDLKKLYEQHVASAGN
ncbi:MAG TPA: peptidylprolyl isomerase [Thermoanaerobaculia bacterium]|nr:peptidylprolyl isomerase [Thermoanaerobaculia bacterium]